MPKLRTADERKHNIYWILWLQFIFLVTGVSQTILVNLISYHGGANESTMIPPMIQYISMILCYFIPGGDEKPVYIALTKRVPNDQASRWLPFICLWDCMANVLIFFAIITAGSGIFQLVFSSILIVTATLRHFTLGKRLSWHKWVSCIIVTAGLFLSCLGLNINDSTVPEDDLLVLEKDIRDGRTVSSLWTLFLPILSTCAFAMEYVMIEKYASLPGAVGSREMCVKCGCFGTAVFTFYLFIYVIPRWDVLMINSIKEMGGNPTTVIWSYIGTCLANLGHNLTYFMLLGSAGSVSTGINQSLRAVFVFVISAVCFCDIQQSQCFNSYKFLSLVVVIGGVLRYAQVSMYEEGGLPTSPKKKRDLLMIDL